MIGDQLIGFVLKSLYKKQKSGLLYRTTYSIDSTKADFIVLGSSRANHDYDPKVFESELNSSFYNCGRDKQGLLYSCAVLSAITKRYTPKCVIIDIRPDEFTLSDEGTLATLLPYYDNQAIRPYLNINSRFEQVKMLSRIYPYNSLLTNLIVGLNKKWVEDYKGYVALTNRTSNDAVETLTEPVAPDSLKINAFSSLIKKLYFQKIPVVLIISPIRYNYISTVSVKECFLLAKKYKNVRFYNFLNKPDWKNYYYYSDNNHLNKWGAAIYSSFVAQFLNTNLGTHLNKFN